MDPSVLSETIFSLWTLLKTLSISDPTVPFLHTSVRVKSVLISFRTSHLFRKSPIQVWCTVWFLKPTMRYHCRFNSFPINLLTLPGVHVKSLYQTVIGPPSDLFSLWVSFQLNSSIILSSPLFPFVELNFIIRYYYYYYSLSVYPWLNFYNS